LARMAVLPFPSSDPVWGKQARCSGFGVSKNSCTCLPSAVSGTHSRLRLIGLFQQATVGFHIVRVLRLCSV
jgi:hypothetical protein